LAKEGIPVILTIVLLSIILITGALVTKGNFLKILVVVSWFLIIFSIYFFRDPERTIPMGDNVIVSPADGKIIFFQETKENEFFKTEVQKVSIFMSAFDVHVNRIPIDGQVIYFNYQKGKFHPAFKDNACYENEQTIIAIQNDKIKILFKQIAGIMARRIVCHIRESSKVKKGDRFGMIKFGSRIDLFLPKQVQFRIGLHEKVKAGETVLGIY